MEIIISIPHFSTFIPPEFNSEFNLSSAQMNKHIDYGTEKIFDFSEYNVLKALASRFVVDLNRERDDLSKGQGVIITETWDNEPVLKNELTAEKIEERLQKYYDPFYKKLEGYISKFKKPFFFLDGHSMDSYGSSVAGDLGVKRPEIDLASGRGTVSEEILKIFEEKLIAKGYDAQRNNPYSGARAKLIHYCHDRGAEALELEVNKSVYMDEKTFEFKEEAIQKLRKTLSECLEQVKEI